MTGQPSFRRWTLLLPALLLAASAAAQDARPLLDAPFQDHAVLQRDAPIRVWGAAAAGETVTVELAGATASAEADASGRWSAELPARPAGGPYALTARASGGAAQTAEDVHVGDVFLCTGQSNMEVPVSRSLYAPFEIRAATDGRIRMLTIPHVASPVPQDTLPATVAWEVGSPETVGDWSASCYYFARDLRRSGALPEDVPVGLITAAWGGSGIRSWMGADALAAVGGYDEALDILDLYTRDEAAAQQALGQTWEAWWRDQTSGGAGAEPWQPTAGAAWAEAPAGLGDWTQWDDLVGFTGMVWFRTTVELTAEQAAQDAALHLGAVDEVDQTWINGHVVANTFGYGTERTYTIPADLLREGENVVVMNVLNTYATGGLIGDHALRALQLTDGTRLPLDDWRYLPVRDAVGAPPRAPWESVGGLSTIHNAMTAPLHGLGLRAALWYQGESDTQSGDEYEALLRALIDHWRRQYGADLPVLVVQLPNYGPLPTAPGESGWAEVREAQRLATMGDPRAGLAVTIDVGDPRDLHPANKQAVGARLARAGRHAIYGEDVTPSGPLPVRAERRGDAVVISFEDVTDGLVVYGDARPIGFELCGAEGGTCRYAIARVEGDSVVLEVEDGQPAERVRYAWADSPIVTLFDGSGLPVGPFERVVEGAP